MELQKYFEKRFSETKPKKPTNLPFITISRETGCGAIEIVKLLIKEFKAKKGEKWRYIDKAVLTDSAEELKLDKSKISYVFEAKTKTHADEILSALSSRYYKSNKVVRKTIKDVIKHYAEEGRVILVGRAGAAITAGMGKGIHIRLIAPVSWRVDSLMKVSHMSLKQTREYIADIDNKRKKLFAFFCNNKDRDMCFDLTINCAGFSRKQIVEIILHALEQKQMI